MADYQFGNIGFSETLRPSQLAASEIIKRQLEAGEKQLHIVAPPGSGKTILGLHVWADLVRRPALVLSPNSAIQAQWNRHVSPGHAVYVHSNEGKDLLQQARDGDLVSHHSLHLKDVYL